MATIGLAISNIAVQKSLREARAATERAEANFDQIAAALEEMIRTLDKAKAPEALQLRSPLAQSAAAFFRNVIAENGDDPASRYETAMAHSFAARFVHMGRPSGSYSMNIRDDGTISYRGTEAESAPVPMALVEAKQHRLAAMKILDDLLVVSPNERRLRIAAAKTCLQLTTQPTDALDFSYAPRGLELYEKLAADYPEAVNYRAALASLHFWLARHSNVPSPRPAESHWSQAIALYRQLEQEQPQNPIYMQQLLAVLNTRANVKRMNGDIDGALLAKRNVIEELRRILRNRPGEEHVAKKLKDEWSALFRRLVQDQRFRDAVEDRRRFLAWVENTPIPPRHMTDAHRLRDLDLAFAQFGLAEALGRAGEGPEAREAFQEAFRRTSPYFTENLVRQHYYAVANQIGWALFSNGLLPEAEEIFRRNCELLKDWDHQALCVRKDSSSRSNELSHYLAPWTSDWEIHGDFSPFRSFHALSLLLHDLGRSMEAERIALKGIEALESLWNAEEQRPHVLLGEITKQYVLLARIQSTEGQFEQARNTYLKATELSEMGLEANDVLGKPSYAECFNDFAWFQATCPDETIRDGENAVQWADRATQIWPREGAFWNTLGVAHHRAGEHREAVQALSRSMELRSGGDPTDWFFLAMAHWRLGEEETAHHWRERAVAWMEACQTDNEELLRFRAEADELLGTGDAVAP